MRLQLENINNYMKVTHFLFSAKRAVAGLALCVAFLLFPSATFAADYTVKSGDWLSKIAPAFNVDWQALCSFNNIVDCNLIFPGQVIQVPEEGYIAPTVAKPAPVRKTVVVSQKPAIQAAPVLSQPSGRDAWDTQLQQAFGSNWQHAKRVMLCESGGNPLAIGPTDKEGYNPIGLFQIKNFRDRPSTAELKNGATNIAWAAKASNGGTNWKIWQCK